MLAGRGLATVPEEDFLPEVGETPELPTASPPPVSLPLHYNTEAHANTFLESSSPTHAHSPSHKAIAPLPQQHPSSVFPAGQIPLQQQHQQTSIKSPQQHHHQQQKEPQLVPLPTQSPPASFQASLGIASVPAQAQHLQPQQQSPNSSLQLQQPPTPPQQQLQQLQQPLTPPQQQLQQPLSPQLQSQQCPRSFIRSHSQHDLSTPPQPISLGDSSFVVPSVSTNRLCLRLPHPRHSAALEFLSTRLLSRRLFLSHSLSCPSSLAHSLTPSLSPHSVSVQVRSEAVFINNVQRRNDK